MAELVQSYIAECSCRHVEPYYAILEGIHQGIIHADIDFISLPSLRVWMHCLISFPASGKKSANSSTPSFLGTLSFQQGVNKDKHHPPVKSNTLIAYSKLAAKYKPLELTTIAGGLGLKLAGAMSSTMRHYSHSLTVVRLRGVCLSTAATGATQQQRSPCNAEIERFVSALPFLIQLTMLDISDSSIGDSAIEGVAQAVCQLVRLDELHLAGCALTDLSASPISAMITSNAAKSANSSFLESLRGETNSQPKRPQEGTRRRNSRGLRVLNVARNLLGDKTAMKVGVALGRDEVLESLLMTNNAVTTKGLFALFGFTSSLYDEKHVAASKSGLAATDGSFLSSSSRLSFLDVSSNPCAADASSLGMLCSVAEAHGYCATAGLYQSQFVVTRQQKMANNNASKFDVTSIGSEGKTHQRPAALSSRRIPSPLNESPEKGESGTPSRTPLSKKNRCEEELHPPPPPQQHQQQQGFQFPFPFPFWPPVAPSSNGTAAAVQFVPFPMLVPVMGMPNGQWPQFANNAATAECSQCRKNQNSEGNLTAQPTSATGEEGNLTAQPTSATGEDAAAKSGNDTVGNPTANPLLNEDVGMKDEEERPLEMHDLLAEEVLTSNEKHSDSGDFDADGKKKGSSPTIPQGDDAVGKNEFERFKDTVLQSMMVQEETASASNEQLRGELRRSNERVEELSLIVHNALLSVDKTSEALNRERAAFLEAKRVQDEWLQTHPEDAIAQDVVSLIHTGIDRIRSLVNPTSAHAVSAASQGISPLPAPSKFSLTSNSALPLRSSSNIVNSFDNNKKQEVGKSHQQQRDEGCANSPPTLHSFLGDVKSKLSKLGW